MVIHIRTPYRNEPLHWLKGNLHTHTGCSDGPRTPQGMIDEYAVRGFDFLMISDHDRLTDVSDLDARGMTLIPGNEISANGPHLLHVGARTQLQPDADRQSVIDVIAAEEGLAILCHPNWESHFNHCPQEDLQRWTGYTGIEIYNGVITWLEGSPMATDRWDRLLGAGRKVWGFANDDCHRIMDIGVAWNVVQSGERDAASIVNALREGRFYASTGVTIDRIRAFGDTIAVQTQNAQRIIAYSDYGRRRALVDARAMTFTIPDDAEYTYIRFECWGRPQEFAWTQPFFIERL